MLPHLISKASLTAVFVWDVESVKSQVSEFAQIKSYTASQEILWKAAQYSNSADKTKQQGHPTAIFGKISVRKTI